MQYLIVRRCKTPIDVLQCKSAKGESMYEIGEYIVHPGQGVCRVEGVGDGPDATYKLLPMGQRHAIHISYPVASESRLRPVLSADEARAIIEQYPAIEVDDFTERNNSLEEQHFKKTIRNGTCYDAVRVVKTFKHRIAEVEGRNKKAPVAYERILKQARERSAQELSCALGCTVEDVDALFQAVKGVDAGEN